MTMDKTVITVVIATKDRHKDLAACLRALHRQTIADSIEVCVINDGGASVSGVVESASGRCETQWFDLPTSVGQVAARNIGIGHASGTYIAFCDDDDRHLPTHLARLVAAVIDSGRSWGHAQAEIVTLRGQAGAWQSAARQPFAFHVTGDLLRVTNPVIPATLLCSRPVLVQAGGLDDSMGHYWDWDLVLRLCQLDEPAEVSDCSALYGVYPDRPSQSHNPSDMRDDLERLIAKHALGQLPSHNFSTMLSDPAFTAERQPGTTLWNGDNQIWNG